MMNPISWLKESVLYPFTPSAPPSENRVPPGLSSGVSSIAKASKPSHFIYQFRDVQKKIDNITQEEVKQLNVQVDNYYKELDQPPKKIDTILEGPSSVFGTLSSVAQGLGSFASIIYGIQSLQEPQDIPLTRNERAAAYLSILLGSAGVVSQTGAHKWAFSLLNRNQEEQDRLAKTASNVMSTATVALTLLIALAKANAPNREAIDSTELILNKLMTSLNLFPFLSKAEESHQNCRILQSLAEGKIRTADLNIQQTDLKTTISGVQNSGKLNKDVNTSFKTLINYIRQE